MAKRGQFKPGQSGNPRGRPKGARHKATLAAQKLLDGESEALTRTGALPTLGAECLVSGGEPTVFLRALKVVL
jgi:hypothetical protein